MDTSDVESSGETVSVMDGNRLSGEKSAERYVLRFDAEGRLGIKLILARDKASHVIVLVEEVLESPHKDRIRVGDILSEVNTQSIECFDEASFSELIAKLAQREDAVELGFIRPLKKIVEPRTDQAALLEYEARAQADDGKAAYNASMLRANGLGGREDDVAAALLYLRKSAQLGVVRAQLQLAKLYATGRGGVKKDEDEAFRWYSAAADANDPEALYHLGHAYEFGLGTDRDLHQALFSFFRAAKLGHEKADSRARHLVASQTSDTSSHTTKDTNPFWKHSATLFRDLTLFSSKEGGGAQTKINSILKQTFSISSKKDIHTSMTQQETCEAQLNEPILIAPFSEALRDDRAKQQMARPNEDGFSQLQPKDSAANYQPPTLPPPPSSQNKVSPYHHSRKKTNPFRDDEDR